MHLKPLAGDSLGVRSSAVEVSFDDVSVLVDPGVGLGGTAEGLLPHPVEYEALQSAASRIDEAAKGAEAVVVTHYHYDHFVPLETSYLGLWSTPKRSREVFAEKHVLSKDPENHINQSQKERASALRPVFDGVATRLTYADDEVRKIGPLTLRFSPPVPHGKAGGDLGWVVMVAIESPEERLVYTSDVQGPIETETVGWILAQEPDLVFADGPSLSRGRSRGADQDAAQTNLRRLAQYADLIVDHHLYRGGNIRAFLEPIEETARDAGHAVDSVASYLGKSRFEYEGVRAQLYARHPVEESFHWRVNQGEFASDPIDWRDWTLN